jgi:hypothetical protein
MNLSAQTSNQKAAGSKTEALKVLGNCSMCKERIETAVTASGATSAYWDAKTQMLKVSYNPSKTNTDALAKKIASVGHDTEKYKADDKVYNSLPGCCKYERKK